MLDVITVGSATADVFVYTDKSELITVRNDKVNEEFIAYPSGTKILIRKLIFNTGGGGTNTAVALSRLGLKAGYVGALGKDQNGQIVLDQLAKEGVAFLGHLTDKEQTDYSVVLNSIAHDRTILNYKGASQMLRFERLDARKLKATRWIYFSSLVGESYKTLERIAQLAKSAKIPLAFNPSSYIAEKGERFVGKVMRSATVLILNKEEAGMITKKSGVDEMLRELRRFGPRHIIITDGKEGVYGLCEGQRYRVLAHPVKVAESTGAGDAFAATYVGSLALGIPVNEALCLGMANAESVITGHGAKVGLLPLAKLKARIKKAPYKLTVGPFK